MLHDEAQTIIQKLNLKQHPEGGYYARVYQSSDEVKLINNDRYHLEPRRSCTSIFYMLNKNDFSSWHSIQSDEIWHFYQGSYINIYILNENGEITTNLLGDSLTTEGAHFQICIEAGKIFAAENVDKTTYSLVGCTVAPGFEWKDFKIIDASTLLKLFPQHETIVKKFCR